MSNPYGTIDGTVETEKNIKMASGVVATGAVAGGAYAYYNKLDNTYLYIAGGLLVASVVAYGNAQKMANSLTGQTGKA